MQDNAPPEKAPNAGTPKATDETWDQGKAAAGAHLERRQKRNADLTEDAQRDPSGGAHSGSPDPTNP